MSPAADAALRSMYLAFFAYGPSAVHDHVGLTWFMDALSRYWQELQKEERLRVLSHELE